MNIELYRTIPELVVKPSMMFAYPTCLADVYTPAIEHIYLPEIRYPSLNATVKIAPGQSTMPAKSLKWKLYQTLTTGVKKRPTQDLSTRFIFDARFDTDKNIAHILENICTPVLFARQLLSAHLNQKVDILIVLKANVSLMARQIYEALDLPIYCTNDPVYGNLVQVSNFGSLLAIQPELFNVHIKNYNHATPERVLISRRGTRQLINEAEVIQFLEAQGFTTYYFEDLSLSEKWSIVRNAKVAVAVHGAGTGHFIFNRQGLESLEPDRGLRLIELFSANFTIHTYRHLSATLNGKWCAVRGQIMPETIRSLDFNQNRNVLKSPIKDPFKVDLKSLQLALDYLEITAR